MTINGIKEMTFRNGVKMRCSILCLIPDQLLMGASSSLFLTLFHYRLTKGFVDMFSYFVENLETAPRGDLTDCGGVEPMVIVTVPRLYEYGTIRETLCIHLTPYIVQVHSFPNMSPSVLYG